MATQDQLLPAVNRIDTLFRETDLDHYFLSVQLGEKSLSYCILDSTSNKYIGIGEFRIPVARGAGTQEIRLPFEVFLGKVMTALPVLKMPFKSCKVAWEGYKTTLIPEILFEEKEQKRLFQFNLFLEPHEQIMHETLAGFHAINLYTIPEKANDLICKTFRVAKISHLSSVLVESLFRNFRGQLARPRIFLHIREQWFDLVIMDQAKLHYLNVFEFRQPEDLVYYTIYVLEQLGFHPDQTEVILLGKVNKGTSLFNLIYKYLRRVEFAGRNPTYTYSFIFNEIQPHQYYPLLNLNQCGL